MSNSNNIFHELGEVKGRLGAVEQTVSRIEEKLDNLGMVSSETFEKRREEVDTKLENHELRIDELEKRAIKNDSSFFRKLEVNFEKRLISWLIALVFAGLVWLVVMQNVEIGNLANEIRIIKR